MWSYTDAQYQPPPPYVPASEPFRPFALAAVELPEGLVVLGQVAEGHGVADLAVGLEVELVVETLHADETGERLTWRWRPTGRPGERAGRRRGRRHAPVGQVGPPVRRVRGPRGPRGAGRRRRRVARRRPGRRRRDRAQRLRRLRRRLDVRPGAGLERRAGRHVVRRVRDRRPGARHRPRPDPRRPVGGRPRRRRRHHPPRASSPPTPASGGPIPTGCGSGCSA
ncbi:OB-fold domain-containing protein [Nocardioides sp. TF02-7]|uniref:OB-fold domain-containing protein n=1 Tax=Nocardioides sp. TF02-7 TaxID=2917724 RepID=UPI001F06FAE7|nr:OB-fold domain-containing protein [Nocardioides sp. TF02-7]UMG91477.1 OB-fold domain-containing protein [Nocardioides sp. TF02-7]